MNATNLRFLSVPLAAVLLGACGERLDLEVKARIDGQPAAQATVVVDREQLGVTDAQGVFAKQLRKKAGAEIDVTVSKDMPGYRIEPWKSTVLVKLPKDGQAATCRLDADRKAMRYVTFRVSEKDAPVPGAKVTVGGKEAGVTDDKGEIVYLYRQQPAKGAELNVAKTGYGAYRAVRQFEPGQVIEVALNRQAVVAIKALTDEYGRASGVPGLSVSIDGNVVGKTDAQGAYTYTYRGASGKKAVIALAAPGYIPAAWKTTVRLEGPVNLQRYFYPTTPKPIRIGIYRVVGNTPGADLTEVAAQTEQALAAQLFKFPGFREVPSERLQAEVKQRKLNIDRIAAKGWQDTPLRASVDMIVLGSVAKDDDGYLAEAKFHTAGGKVIFSEIARARSARGIDGAVREIVNNVIERFPFEGTVIGVEDERYRINIGRNWRIGRGTEFTLTTPTFAEGGKVSGYRETGRMEVKRGDDASSLAEVATLKKGEKVQIGDRVVRSREGEEGDRRTYFLLTAKGGVGTDVNPLAGTNVYLNGEWKGATGADGQAEIPLRLGRNYTLLLYRHGYQQVAGRISVDKSGEARELVLAANNALVKGDSEPSQASIYLDDKEDYDAAIAEFETVLALPENQQLIYKQFAVTFTNLGHAYCEKGNRLVTSDRDAASSQFAKAIKALQTARQNTRFFPSAEYDEAVHDTYYYTALSYHKLYLLTKQPAVMNSASLAWREYFDFFPKKLEGIPTFVQAREAARRYRDQIQEQ